MSRILGHVAELHRYPVKSMGGESLTCAELDWQGIEGDRQYAWVRTDNASRFPWLTAREVPAMLQHKARFAEPESPKRSPVLVEAPDGAVQCLHGPQLRAHLETAAGEPAHLIQVARGVYDSMPVSIQTTAGHKRVETAHGSAIDPRRFRTNIVIDGALQVDDWQGLRLTFGSEEDGAVVHCAGPIPRCVLVTIDPATGAKEPKILRTVAQHFGNAYGIYAGPARPGLIRLGDAVWLAD